MSRHLRPGLLASHAEIDALEQRSWVEELGVTGLTDLVPRQRTRVAGVLRAVSYTPAGSTTALRAELFDGTGSIDLWWTGRRDVPGIVPGRRLVATGMVARGEIGRPRLVMHNPRYELLAPKAHA